MNNLPTTVATPPKKCGRKRSSSPAMAGPSGTIRVAKPSGYIVLTSGFQIRSTFSGGESGDIGFPGARVGTEILRGRELGRVHEDRDDDLGGAAFRESDQRHVAVMERSHGRYQRDTWLFWRAGCRGRDAMRESCGRSWDFATSGTRSLAGIPQVRRAGPGSLGRQTDACKRDLIAPSHDCAKQPRKRMSTHMFDVVGDVAQEGSVML